uniref:Secreted protein n=1 Tax=Streptomyces sp. NBC_01401 TaxID=2903854 RepID=A0AAU3GWS2_9ACTN
MQRGFVHAVAWSLATGAAVTLSWWGVHTVMSGTAYDPPRAVPISARAGQATNVPVSSSTHRSLPSPSPSATASPTTPTPSPPASRKPSTPAPSPSRDEEKPPADAGDQGDPTASGEVKSYPTRGGRVVLELADDSAKLVSATPEQGWSMQVWTNPEWIRVDFSDGAGATVSVFCTWNGHPPLVEIVDQ